MQTCLFKVLLAIPLVILAMNAGQLNEPIQAGSNLAYADLLRLVCKDLKIDA